MTRQFPGSTGQAASLQPRDRHGGWLAGESTWNVLSGSSGQEALGKRFGIGLVELLLPSGLLGHQFLKPDVSGLKPQEGVSHGCWLCWEEISLQEIRTKSQSWITYKLAREQILHTHVCSYMCIPIQGIKYRVHKHVCCIAINSRE